MTPTDILERLKAATGPDRELDALIYRALNPRFHDMHADCRGWLVGGDHDNPKKSPTYTSSIDAALALVEKLLPCEGSGPDWILGRTNGGLTVHCQIGSDKDEDMCFGETPALAILIALFTALVESGRG